jgi:hypothetical protein
MVRGQALAACRSVVAVAAHEAAHLPLQSCQQAPAGVKKALWLVQLQCAAFTAVQGLQGLSISYLQVPIADNLWASFKSS